MTHSYEFAVLRASPDRTRDERVNVGIVVATPDGIDIRAPELRKLRILTGHEWEDIASAYDARLSSEWRECPNLGALRDRIGAVSEIFSLSNLGALAADPDKPGEYESRVAAVLRTYVDQPRLSKGERQHRINAEIAKMLRKAGVFYRKGETIEDHKVVPRYARSIVVGLAQLFRNRPKRIEVMRYG